ncbi:MAG: hypothetical protein WBK19_20505 [Azonexus sp.]
MNAHDPFVPLAATNHASPPSEILRLFAVETLQQLDPDNAVRCQQMLGHGDAFGVWETPSQLAPFAHNAFRVIDLRRRLVNYLPEGIESSPALSTLLDEAVLQLTRYALLMRLGPASLTRGGERAGTPLKPLTIATVIYRDVPAIIARGIAHRLKSPDTPHDGFVSQLTAEYLHEFRSGRYLRAQLDRMSMLQAQGLWTDAPTKIDFKGKTTSPLGAAQPRYTEKEHVPYPPIPDAYMAEMGPRVLWVVRDLGPNLLHLFESIPEFSKDLAPGAEWAERFQPRLKRYFAQHTWRDRNGEIITAPPFWLRHGTGHGKNLSKDPSKMDLCEWPPRTWSSLQALAVTLQSAHLWITLLALGSRLGEVMTLDRDCIEWARDGNPYANGKTYKLHPRLGGVEREWPAPEVLVDSLAQQFRLVEAWERIACLTRGDDAIGQQRHQKNDHLWASLGNSNFNDPEKVLKEANSALRMLATRFGQTPKPGGKNLHAHRFRKTIARLAGIAIVGSPRVLMRLFGHRDIAMTLHYILTDKALAAEIEQVARELRIMHCQELIEDMHAALHRQDELPYGGHGGGGAPLMTETVMRYEGELHRAGKDWGANSAYELSVILTNNGRSFRLVNDHLVCTKAPGETGLCIQKRGEANTGNCQSGCTNRIEKASARDEVNKVIPILIANAFRAQEDNQLLVAANYAHQLSEELSRFDDISTAWRENPAVASILETMA